jgi:NAD-dependent deacetylase
MDKWIEKAKEMLAEANRAFVLTGAGISTESGIPDFRGSNGLWRNHDVMEVASLQNFKVNAAQSWEFYKERWIGLKGIEPNDGHYALAQLEREGKIAGILTQNIDGLHRRAGSKNVYEVHGTIQESLCLDCRSRFPMTDTLTSLWVEDKGYPICPNCEGVLKPGVILFGEDLPSAFLEGLQELDSVDLLVCCGSSLEVVPVARIPYWIKDEGGKVIVINMGRGGFDEEADLVIGLPLGETLPKLLNSPLEK